MCIKISVHVTLCCEKIRYGTQSCIYKGLYSLREQKHPFLVASGVLESENNCNVLSIAKDSFSRLKTLPLRSLIAFDNSSRSMLCIQHKNKSKLHQDTITNYGDNKSAYEIKSSYNFVGTFAKLSLSSILASFFIIQCLFFMNLLFCFEVVLVFWTLPVEVLNAGVGETKDSPIFALILSNQGIV